MAQILVMTDPSETDGEVVYSETWARFIWKVTTREPMLVERLRWAVRDAQVAEHRASLRAVEPREERPAA